VRLDKARFGREILNDFSGSTTAPLALSLAAQKVEISLPDISLGE